MHANGVSLSRKEGTQVRANQQSRRMVPISTSLQSCQFARRRGRRTAGNPPARADWRSRSVRIPLDGGQSKYFSFIRTAWRRATSRGIIMARLSRFFLPNQPMHVIHRGKDGKRVFFGKTDYALYREWLAEASTKYGCAVHAYVLMPNHVHLLVTPKTARSLPRLMQSLGRRHSRHVNIGRGLDGSRWEGRYRAAPIEAGTHLIDCMRYIESNPVRLKLARNPGGHPWSSFESHAKGHADPALKDHRLYQALGASAARRGAAYSKLMTKPLSAEFIAALRAATNGGWALGGDGFKRRLAEAAGRRVVPLPRGRPRKGQRPGTRGKRKGR